eukprot:CCRYP_001427-RB/>CCRYP_001427-RB protein AED:0.30 eAED:0.30 QI:731/0.33/0.5/1/0/0/4/0/297
MEEIEAFFSSDMVTSRNSGGEKASQKQQALRDLVRSFKKLTDAGYIEAVKPIITAQEMIHLEDKEKVAADGIRGGEFEFNVQMALLLHQTRRNVLGQHLLKNSKISKKTRQSSQLTRDENDVNDYGRVQSQPDNPEIVSHLKPLSKLIPLGSVYLVKTTMIIGQMVQEFYGPQSILKSNAKDNSNLLHVGGIVTAALTFGARQEHAPIEQYLDLRSHKRTSIVVWQNGEHTLHIVPYLPADALKEMLSLVGGTIQNPSATLIHMSQLKYPPIVVQVEDASGHPSGGKFEICRKQLLK